MKWGGSKYQLLLLTESTELHTAPPPPVLVVVVVGRWGGGGWKLQGLLSRTGTHCSSCAHIWHTALTPSRAGVCCEPRAAPQLPPSPPPPHITPSPTPVLLPGLHRAGGSALLCSALLVPSSKATGLAVTMAKAGLLPQQCANEHGLHPTAKSGAVPTGGGREGGRPCSPQSPSRGQGSGDRSGMPRRG